MVVTQGYKQLGAKPRDTQTCLRLAGKQMCSSADPQDNSHVVQQEVAAEDGPSPHEV